MENHEVFEAVRNAAQAGQQSVLATVVRTKGSVPRHAGSRMVIDGGGALIGTIGGGCGEADVIETARVVLASGQPQLVRVELMDAVDSWSPAVCGGVMDVFIEPIGTDSRP
jgi:xanthine/CO dehydrogenase XdhC/CoxF family maturation factor